MKVRVASQNKRQEQEKKIAWEGIQQDQGIKMGNIL